MGPQLDSCGRRRSRHSRAEIAAALQWGRNLTVAEGMSTGRAATDAIALQWGRNLTVAEGARYDGPTIQVGKSFNGAAT